MNTWKKFWRRHDVAAVLIPIAILLPPVAAVVSWRVLFCFRHIVGGSVCG